jgi:hypothetical protein
MTLDASILSLDLRVSPRAVSPYVSDDSLRAIAKSIRGNSAGAVGRPRSMISARVSQAISSASSPATPSPDIHAPILLVAVDRIDDGQRTGHLRFDTGLLEQLSHCALRDGLAQFEHAAGKTPAPGSGGLVRRTTRTRLITIRHRS